MTREQMDFLHGLIAEGLSLSGSKVVWANQNMPRLKKPFATLQLFAVRHETSEELRIKGPGRYNVVVPTTATLSVQYFGEDALTHIETMLRSFDRPTVVDRCFAEKVAVYDAESTTDLSDLLEGQTWEERAGVDLHIRYNSEVEDNPGYIESLVIEADVEKHLPKDEDASLPDINIPDSGDSDSSSASGDSSSASDSGESGQDEKEYYVDTVEVDGTLTNK